MSASAEINYAIFDLYRRLNNLLLSGVITELDHAQRRVRVHSDQLDCDWIPWPAEIGRNYIRWRPLRLSTSVLLACPSGDPAQAEIIGMSYIQPQPAPSSDPELDLIEFDSGSKVLHNASTGDISIVANNLRLETRGDLTIDCQGVIDETATQHIGRKR